MHYHLQQIYFHLPCTWLLHQTINHAIGTSIIVVLFPFSITHRSFILEISGTRISIYFYSKNPIQLKASSTKLHNPCSVSAPFVWPFQLMNLSKFSPDLGQTKFMRWTVQHTHSRPQSYISLHWPWDDDIVLTISTINQDW